MAQDRTKKHDISVFRNPVRTLKTEELMKVTGGWPLEGSGATKPSAIPDDASGYFR